MSRMLCCNECGREQRERLSRSYRLYKDGNINEAEGTWTNGHWFDYFDEDGVEYTELTGQVRECRSCKEEVMTYKSKDSTDWDFWWRVVQRLDGLKYVTESLLEKLVVIEKKSKRYRDRQLSRWVDGTCGVDGRTTSGMIQYLQERNLLGPVEKYRLFFERYPVLVDENTKRHHFLPRLEAPIDGSCPKCGKHQFFGKGDTCQKCNKGTLDYVSVCEPAEFQGKEEFVIAGERLNKEQFKQLFCRYTQAQVRTEENVLSTARERFDGKIRPAAEAIERRLGGIDSTFKELNKRFTSAEE